MLRHIRKEIFAGQAQRVEPDKQHHEREQDDIIEQKIEYAAHTFALAEFFYVGGVGISHLLFLSSLVVSRREASRS